MTNSEFHFEFAGTLLKFFICTAFLFYFINFKSRCAFAVCLLLSRWSPGNHHNSDWEGSEGSHETGRWNFLQVLQACCRIPAGSHQNWNQRGLWCYFWFSGSQVRKLKKRKSPWWHLIISGIMFMFMLMHAHLLHAHFHPGWLQPWCSTSARCAPLGMSSRPGTLWRCWRPERTSDTSTLSRDWMWGSWRARGWRLRRKSVCVCHVFQDKCLES